MYVGTLDGGIEAWVAQSTSPHSKSEAEKCLKSTVEWEYVVENRASHMLPIEGAYQVEGRSSAEEENGGLSTGAMYLVSKLYL